MEWDLVPRSVAEAADVPKASKEETLSLSRTGQGVTRGDQGGAF